VRISCNLWISSMCGYPVMPRYPAMYVCRCCMARYLNMTEYPHWTLYKHVAGSPQMTRYPHMTGYSHMTYIMVFCMNIFTQCSSHILLNVWPHSNKNRKRHCHLCWYTILCGYPVLYGYPVICGYLVICWYISVCLFGVKHMVVWLLGDYRIVT
jgi:hypothetical protein